VRARPGTPPRRPAARRAALAGDAPAGDERNRRQALVRAAARLFRDQGFDGTTIRQIAAAAGMRSGSPFYHFKDMQELLATVMEEGLLAGHEKTRAVLDSGLPLRERFHGLVRAHLETIHGRGNDFIPVLLHDFRRLDAPRRRRIAALRDRYDDSWRGIVGELRAAGLLRRDSPLCRLWIIGAINFSVHWYRPGRGLDLDALAADVVAQFLNAPAC